jgi:hypothetical protein
MMAQLVGGGRMKRNLTVSTSQAQSVKSNFSIQAIEFAN